VDESGRLLICCTAGNSVPRSESDVAAIADRLERDDYANAFESLNDWHILRALAFKGSELADPYRHLLDVESFDEC